jgi:hypothetical protein
MSNGFNTFKVNDSTHVDNSRDLKKITNLFKYKCETLSCYVYFNIYTNKCNMQHLNNGFNKFKVDDLTHVKMLIVQEMWKNSPNY